MKKIIKLSVSFLFALAVGTQLLPSYARASPPGGTGGSPCVQSPSFQYGGRAYALDVDLNLLIGGHFHVGPISDTGYLGANGGMLEANFLALSTPAPIAIEASILDAMTTGSGNMAVSFANVVGLNLNVADTVEVTAGILQATAKESAAGSCPNISMSNAGTGATIVDLAIKIAGIPVAVGVNAAPNTTITVPGVARIVINEQYVANGRQNVNALHVSLLTGVANAEVIVAHAEADLIFAGCSCTATSCPVKDFVTGGGWITLASGEKGTFGFVGGVKANGLQGHLNYIDHATGQHLAGTAVTNYFIPSNTSTQRVLQYACSVNNVADSCTLAVSDNGEPGAGVDGFSVSSRAYSASGPTITKGNIQLHRPQGCAAPKKGK